MRFLILTWDRDDEPANVRSPLAEHHRRLARRPAPMIDYRVDDLDGFSDQLRSAGVAVAT